MMNLSLGDNEILREGSTGDQVRVLQQLLTERGFDTRGIDRIFGPNTVKAVKVFQGNFGLTIDGIVGPQTWGELLKATTSARAVPPPPLPSTVGAGLPSPRTPFLLSQVPWYLWGAGVIVLAAFLRKR